MERERAQLFFWQLNFPAVLEERVLHLGQSLMSPLSRPCIPAKKIFRKIFFAGTPFLFSFQCAHYLPFAFPFLNKLSFIVFFLADAYAKRHFNFSAFIING